MQQQRSSAICSGAGGSSVSSAVARRLLQRHSVRLHVGRAAAAQRFSCQLCRVFAAVAQWMWQWRSGKTTACSGQRQRSNAIAAAQGKRRQFAAQRAAKRRRGARQQWRGNHNALPTMLWPVDKCLFDDADKDESAWGVLLVNAVDIKKVLVNKCATTKESCNLRKGSIIN